jgi:hypothetical protein
MIPHSPWWRNVTGRPGRFPFRISTVAVWELITNGGLPVNVCSKTRKVGGMELLPEIPLAHTSTATIANVNISPSLLAGPPSNISGAAHVVVFAVSES